jgi:hypothetical protein
MSKYIETARGDRILVDEEYAEILNMIAWRLDKNGYAVGTKPTRYGKGTFYMHRLIAVPPAGYEIDHIDGDRANNQLSNLRICKHSENCANRSKDARNTSGFKGVNWDASRKMWLARIKHNGKQLNLGRFDDARTAFSAYCNKAAELKGEFVNYG